MKQHSKLNFYTREVADRFNSVTNDLKHQLFEKIADQNAYYLRYRGQEQHNVIDVVLDFVLKNCNTTDQLFRADMIGSDNSYNSKKSDYKEGLVRWLHNKQGANVTAIDLFTRILTTKTGGFVDGSKKEGETHTPLTQEYIKQKKHFTDQCEREYQWFKNQRTTQSSVQPITYTLPNTFPALEQQLTEKSRTHSIPPWTARKNLAAYNNEMGICILESILEDKLYHIDGAGIPTKISLTDLFPSGSTLEEIRAHVVKGECPIQSYDIAGICIMKDDGPEPLLLHLHLEGEGLIGSIAEAMAQMQERSI